MQKFVKLLKMLLKQWKCKVNNLNINEIEKIIGYTFQDKELLIQAFTHSSYAHEHSVKDYERLEFLGDSLLETLTTIFLFNNFNEDEGSLSKIRAKVVSAQSLYGAVESLKLKGFIRLGGSIDKSNIPLNIIADVFESIVAGIYLDSKDINLVYKFVRSCLLISKNHVLDIINQLTDYKTLLQEKLQAIGKSAIYEAEEIKEGNNISFLIKLIIDNKVVAQDVASSKKSGEQACAKNILEENGGKF